MKGVIFDMDGLMVDTEAFYFAVQREMAQRRGKSVDEGLFHRMMGQKPLDSMRLFVGELGLGEAPEDLLSERDVRIVECIRRELRPMPGLFEIVGDLRSVARLAIGTGNTRRMVDEVLVGLGLVGVFDYVQTSDDVARGKPSPEIFLRAVEALGLRPGDVAVLEDSSNGIRAAVAAGCLALAVPNEHTCMQDFSLAYRVFGSLCEARDFLLGWVRV